MKNAVKHHWPGAALAITLVLSACARLVATQGVEPGAVITTIAPTVAPTSNPVEPGTAGTGTQAVSPGSGMPVTGEDIRTYVIVAEQTTAQYEVNEVFFNENNRLNTAIGITSAVNGEVLLNFSNPQKSTLGEITIDISALKSDSNRRDNAIRDRWLESSRFPIARFVTTSVEGLPAKYDMGSDINFKVHGDLTIRDVTAPVTLDVTAKLDGDSLTGTATTQILMTDFGFNPPDIAGMLKAENQAKLVIHFTANKK